VKSGFNSKIGRLCYTINLIKNTCAKGLAIDFNFVEIGFAKVNEHNSLGGTSVVKAAAKIRVAYFG